MFYANFVGYTSSASLALITFYSSGRLEGATSIFIVHGVTILPSPCRGNIAFGKLGGPSLAMVDEEIAIYDERSVIYLI